MAAYLSRLERAAKSFPRKQVKEALGSMKKRIIATRKAKGKHITSLD